MARPTKQGVDYFPVDCQFDDKIELLIADKGANAVSILITIWQLIYQNEGYYISYSSDLFLLVKRRLMLDVSTIEEILTAAICRGIFDTDIYNKYKILTSKAIQKRYFIASKKKKNINVVDNYICSGVSVGENSTSKKVNSYENATNVNVKEDVKEKEKVNVKEKKSKPEKKYSSEFLHAMSIYPPRAGGNPKGKAWHAWSARLRSEVAVTEMTEGVKRYFDFCQATGKIGTEFVKQAATFFGPDEHFKELWTIPVAANKQEALENRNRAIANEWANGGDNA